MSATVRGDRATGDRGVVMEGEMVRAALVLEDGTRFEGESFGAAEAVSGEVVFNTGMVGYVESLTDPSYRGQVLVCTYPLIGNYGVPRDEHRSGLSTAFESDEIHAAGLVVADYSRSFSHWNAGLSLGEWMGSQGVPGVTGIDTRVLTQRLRERGSMLGRIEVEGRVAAAARDPNTENLVAEVSNRSRQEFLCGVEGARRVVLVDTGAKLNIIHSLLSRGVDVVRVPWDHDVPSEFEARDGRSAAGGLMLSNGPGDATMCGATIEGVRAVLGRDVRIFGICLGNQLLALAIGARTYKLKYGHRGQNQPVIECGTNRCFITSQNHGYAVDTASLPRNYRPFFENLNDQTNEGIRHAWKPIRSVQFHPEANPGPVDTAYLFDEFVQIVNERAAPV